MIMLKVNLDKRSRGMAVQKGAEVLDVPCGNGRLTVELASRKYRTTGVDLSAEILEDATQLAERREVNICLEQRDMRDLPWKDHFDAALCFGNSFAYLGDEGDAAFLKAVRQALKPSCRFLLETGLVAESRFPAGEKNEYHELGDLLFLIKSEFDVQAGRMNTRYTVVRDGETDCKHASFPIYTCPQLCHMFERAGFVELNCWGSMQEEPFKLGAGVLYILATKPSL